jgi:hypothetical protein
MMGTGPRQRCGRQVCKFHITVGCKHGVCAFARSFKELRYSHSYVVKKGILDRMANGQLTSEDHAQLNVFHGS